MSIVIFNQSKLKKCVGFFRVKNLYKAIKSFLFQHKRFAKNKPITYNALIRFRRIQKSQVIRGHYPPDRNDTRNPVDLLQFATYCFPPVATKKIKINIHFISVALGLSGSLQSLGANTFSI